MRTQAETLEQRLAFTLGDRLAKALAAAELTNNDIAQRLDVSRNTISNYINGNTHPKRLYLKEWALATGVPLEWLETGHFPNEKSPHTHGAHGGKTEPPVGLEPTTCSLQGNPSPIIHLTDWKQAA